ncbi:hypothetical protein SAMN02799616_01155 [Paenibacillus sp. UNC499MF]|nr:hypothetical protein SAMN02799616_01155 [Paenibacillus sp. UNC499MF]
MRLRTEKGGELKSLRAGNSDARRSDKSGSLSCDSSGILQ